MKIAYMIAAHTDALQLKRLVLSLKEVYTDFYIHIDSKSDISSFVQELKGIDVVFIKNRVNTNWGGVVSV